jgi:hypothetical protein
MAFLTGTQMMIVAGLIVAAVLIYLFMNGDLSIESITKDNPFVGLGTSADTATWHNSIGQNQVAVSAAGIRGAGEPPVWFNYEMPRPGLYGKPPVEFKYGTDEKRVHAAEYKDETADHGHPAHQGNPYTNPYTPVVPVPKPVPVKPIPKPVPVEPVVDPYGDKNIYNTWADPMGVFPQNVGAFKTKRLVRNRDWANVLVGVPGGNNVEVDNRLDKMFFPNQQKVTPEDRLKMYGNAPLNDPIGNASPPEFMPNLVYNVDRIQNRVVG